MKVITEIEGLAFPTKTVEVLDTDEVLLRLHEAGSLVFCDPEGEAMKKGKAVYVAGLRRGIDTVLRVHTKVGAKVYSVTLALADKVPKTKRGRKRSHMGKEVQS